MLQCKFSGLILLILCLTFCISLGSADNLYEILGLKRGVPPAEIKKAYKQLAREWHPDKNPDPEANERFMKINEAYETLIDPEKRSDYDNYGHTSAQANQQKPTVFHPFFNDPFGPFAFRDQRPNADIAKFHVTYRSFTNGILPESSEKPYLLYSYTDFCFHCRQVEQIWSRVVADLEAIGFGIGTFNAHHDGQLSNALGLRSVPSIIGVSNQVTTFFSGPISVSSIREFTRSLIPSGLYIQLTDQNYKEVLSGYHDNKVRAVFFDNKPQPSLRFLVPLLLFKERVLAAYVDLSRPDSCKDILQRYNVRKTQETLMIFKEDTELPAAVSSAPVLGYNDIRDQIDAHKYLVVPRLSSQTVLDYMCPANTLKTIKSLCVILISPPPPANAEQHRAFRTITKSLADPDTRFTYVSPHAQTSFTNSLLKNVESGSKEVQVAVLWRKDRKIMSVDLLEGGLPVDGSQEAERKLESLLRYVHSGIATEKLVILEKDLYNEDAGPLLKRMINRMLHWFHQGIEAIKSIDSETAVIIGTTLSCIVICGLLIKTIFTTDIPPPTQAQSTRPPSRPHTPANHIDPMLDLRPVVYEVNCTSYDNIIESLEPGQRLVLLLVDIETKHKLVTLFTESLKTFTKSRAFKFGYLQLDDYLPWYTELLSITLDNTVDLRNVNMRNCIGTVLAINFRRKYYCIFHRQKALEEARRMGCSGADFMGFDDIDLEETEETRKLYLTELLVGFQFWMERLCEGQPQRLRVDRWPDMNEEE